MSKRRKLQHGDVVNFEHFRKDALDWAENDVKLNKEQKDKLNEYLNSEALEMDVTNIFLLTNDPDEIIERFTEIILLKVTPTKFLN